MELEPKKEITLKAERSRVGNADRDQAKAHVRHMLDQGYLTGEEAGIRVNHIEHAETVPELQHATYDLPKPKPAFREAWKKFDWDSPNCYVPVLVLTSMLSVAFASVPFILATLGGWYHDGDLMNATAIPAIIIGAIGLVASIITIATKASD